MSKQTDQAIMKQCVEDFRELLESNWDEIASMKDQSEGRIKVAAAFLISFKGNEQAVKTTLTFGRRVSESRESIINADQYELPMDGVEANGEGPDVDSMASPKKTRHRASQEA
jgi:hypothetical protein